MSVSLYRKYRSKSLDEIVGQQGVVKALKTAVSKGALSHAYLFTGPRGVGKTSIARILAYAINDIPYSSDELPVDIIEIDAASNRGIEEIRDLREKAKIAPISSKYKVYIIDEVHMLTTPAFNALLKTLEEPPAHVIFILATTEGHKLPETIISRTQRYNFSLATLDEVVGHLSNIAKQESINIDKPALELIAMHSGGSMRDALSTLDHVRHLADNITVEEVRTNIGLPSQEIIDNLIDFTASGQADKLINELKSAERGNMSAAALSNGLIDALKVQIQSNKLKFDLNKLASLIRALSEVESSNKPYILLTVSLLNAISEDVHPVIQEQVAPHRTVTPKVQQPKEPKIPPKPEPAPIPTKAPDPITNNTTDSNNNDSFSHDSWKNILEDLRSSHNTLYSVLRMAEPNLSELQNNKLRLDFKFPFHQKRISEKKNNTIIHSKFKEHGYGNLEIICGVNANATPKSYDSEPTESKAEQKPNELEQIRGVFDGAEAME